MLSLACPDPDRTANPEVTKHREIEALCQAQAVSHLETNSSKLFCHLARGVRMSPYACLANCLTNSLDHFGRVIPGGESSGRSGVVTGKWPALGVHHVWVCYSGLFGLEFSMRSVVRI